MPKSTVGNWVMVPTKTGGQKSTQDRYRRRSTAVADGGLARAPSLRPPAKFGKSGLSKAQRKTFEAAPPGRVLASEERESARARLRAALVRHQLFELHPNPNPNPNPSPSPSPNPHPHPSPSPSPSPNQVRHWLFESFDSKQIEATAKAMRHQSVPQGKAVSAQVGQYLLSPLLTIAPLRTPRLLSRYLPWLHLLLVRRGRRRP